MEYYGILEKYENQFDRLPIFFPSKVGGTPVWLDPSHTPDLNLIKCEGCKKTMTFFLQMYCPLSFPSAYHRTLFLFCCRSEDCCKNSNVTPFVVLRSNLPQVNEYYGDDADLDLTDEQAASMTKKLLSKFPQKTWQISQLEEYALIVKPIQREENDNLTNLERKLKCCRETPQLGILDEQSERELDELIQRIRNDESNHDSEFESFVDSFADPYQVVRYCLKDKPLYVSKKGKIKDDEVPICKICDQKYVYEFQVYPQILNYTKFLNSKKNNFEMDFGTILIYTCPNSCMEENGNYFKEFAWKQDIY